MTFAIINIINPAYSLPALSHLLQHNVCLIGKEKGNEAGACQIRIPQARALKCLS